MAFYPVQEIAIGKVKPYSKNAKKHPDSQIDLLVKQIAQGFDQPIVVDKNYEIIKGHGRLLACKKMGLETVSVVVRDDLSPTEVKAARLADNKLAETDWDLELLKEELDELSNFIDIIDIGFDQKELDAALDEIANPEEETEYQEPEDQGFSPEDEVTKECPSCGFKL